MPIPIQIETNVATGVIILDYVFKKNDLDYKMEKLIERVEELETKTKSLKEKK